MTKKKLPSIPGAEIDVGHQSGLILAAFSQYLAASPDRSIVLSRPSKRRFRVQLVDKREAHGTTLRDAGAQIATVIRLEGDEVQS
jgi:hypothetical protein